MKRVAIIVALDREFEQIISLLESGVERSVESELAKSFSYVEGRVGELIVGVAKSGVGKVCSALSAAELIKNFLPDCLINTGVGGAIDPSLKLMDVVFSTRTAYHDVWCGEGEMGQVQGFPLYFESSKELSEIASHLKSETPIHTGLIVSGDRFIDSRAEQERIKLLFPEALVVDMEGASIAQTCHIYGIPFISMRIVSDTPGSSEDNFAQYSDFWRSVAENSFAICHTFLEAIGNLSRR